MPRKRYYCDFCDKSFADNQTNRRNHLNGVQHKIARKEHYDSFKDPQMILAEDSSKKPCRKFLQEGDCKFGNSCKFSHLSKEERERYLNNINSKLMQESSKEYFLEKIDAKEIVDKWLTEERLEQLQASTTTSTPAEQLNLRPPFKLPEVFNSFSNLPVSILPYDFKNLSTSFDWG